MPRDGEDPHLRGPQIHYFPIAEGAVDLYAGRPDGYHPHDRAAGGYPSFCTSTSSDNAVTCALGNNGTPAIWSRWPCVRNIVLTFSRPSSRRESSPRIAFPLLSLPASN